MTKTPDVKIIIVLLQSSLRSLSGCLPRFNGVLKRNLIHVARFEAFIVFRGDRDGVDDNVSVGNILRGQAILDPVRATGFNFTS